MHTHTQHHSEDVQVSDNHCGGDNDEDMVVRLSYSALAPQPWLVPLMWAPLKALCLTFSHILNSWQNHRSHSMQTGYREELFLNKHPFMLTQILCANTYVLILYYMCMCVCVCVWCEPTQSRILVMWCIHTVYFYIFKQDIISAKLSVCGSAGWKFVAPTALTGTMGIKCRVKYAPTLSTSQFYYIGCVCAAFQLRDKHASKLLLF